MKEQPLQLLNKMKIKLGIFDDHPVVLQGLLAQFKALPNFDVRVTANTKNELFTHPEIKQLDVLLCDIVSTDITGFEVFDWMKTKAPNTRVIAYSSLNNSLLIENLLLNGVKAFVHKAEAFNTILQAIDAVLKNQIFLPTEYKYLNSNYRPVINNQLTEREIEILVHIANEKTSSEIADALFISISTVENHRKNIFRKLGVKNVAGMVLVANRIGYLS